MFEQVGGGEKPDVAGYLRACGQIDYRRQRVTNKGKQPSDQILLETMLPASVFDMNSRADFIAAEFERKLIKRTGIDIAEHCADIVFGAVLLPDRKRVGAVNEPLTDAMEGEGRFLRQTTTAVPLAETISIEPFWPSTS